MAREENADVQTTISNYHRELAQKLVHLGFECGVEDVGPVFRKHVDSEMRISLLPGAARKYGGVIINPTLSLEYLPLQEWLEIESAKGNRKFSADACYFLLRACGDDHGYFDRWDKFQFIEKGASVVDAVDLVIWTLEHYALRLIKKYASVDALINLYRDSIALNYHKDIVTIDEKWKLEALEHLRGSSNTDR